MPDSAIPALAGILLAVHFLVAWAAFSLRDFSRSRLEEICRKHRHENRFSTILQTYEWAIVTLEIVQLLVLVLYLGMVVLWIEWPVIAPASAGAASPWPGFLIKLAVAISPLLIFSIITAWILARVSGESYLFYAWPVLSVLMTLAWPLLGGVRRLDALGHWLAGQLPPEGEDAADLITEEIRTVVDEGQREGILQSDARTMIHRVMELQDVDVADIMTPRTRMLCADADADLDKVRKLFLDHGHSRIPVIGKTTDDILGLLYAKDLLRCLEPQPGTLVQLPDIVREPFYVPETMGIDSLLKNFKRERVHLAIVLDEYGGVAGLVTMEDILEEIVGEIDDEYDPNVPTQFHIVSDGVSEVDARAHIDDVNERLNLDLPSDEDFDTLGGFVFSLLGRIPVTGEQFDWTTLRFTVLEADKRKLIRLRIEAVPPAEAEDAAD